MSMTGGGGGITAHGGHTFVYLTSTSGGSGAAPAQQLQLSLVQGAPQVLFLQAPYLQCWHL